MMLSESWMGSRLVSIYILLLILTRCLLQRDLETSLYATMGNDQPGEHEEQRTIEFVHHHAIMCLDIKVRLIIRLFERALIIS
jgi:hypothetical protein